MPKRKPASELTRDELAHRVFPPKVVREVKKVAQGCGSQSQAVSASKRPL